MAEELALEERFGERRGVDRDEGSGPVDEARQDLLPEYLAKLAELRTSGLPPYRDTAYGADLARATIQYGLSPITAAA